MITYGQIKRGDTFAFFMTLADEEGNPIIPESIRCHLRDKQYRMVAEATITETDTSGKYLFEWGSTENWPIGSLLFDIEITDVTGGIISTDTMELTVERDVTYGE